MASNSSVLVIDLGGTFVRLGVFHPDSEQPLEHVVKHPVLDYLSLQEAVESYVNQIHHQPRRLSISVAGPAEDDRIELINHPWQFRLSELQCHFALDQIHAMNDFKAIACALPFFTDTDLDEWQQGRVFGQAARIVLGPGTGLGLGVLQPDSNRSLAFATEGGNIGFAPQSPLQDELLKWARVNLPGRIYVEQFVSGPGLCNLANAMSAIEDEPLSSNVSSAQWVEQMLQAEPFALRVLDCFAELLGSYAGDMVLAHGARSGAYLAGGVVTRLQDIFPREVFLAAFADKGRYAAYLQQVPVYLCQHPEPGLLGAGHYACQQDGGGVPA